MKLNNTKLNIMSIPSNRFYAIKFTDEFQSSWFHSVENYNTLWIKYYIKFENTIILFKSKQ